MRKMHSSKHKYDHESCSDEEKSRDSVKSQQSSSHHHRRKHKKHKHKSEAGDHHQQQQQQMQSKNGAGESPLRNENNEIIQIHGSSSEDDCQNGIHDAHDSQRGDCNFESHSHGRHRREDSRHKKRRKRSRSDSGSRDVEISRSRLKKSKHDGKYSGRNNINNSDDSECHSLNKHGKRKAREDSEFDDGQNDELGERKFKEKKSRGNSEIKAKVKIEKQDNCSSGQRVRDKEANRTIKAEEGEGKGKDRQEQSGSRNNTRTKRSSRDREVHEWGGSGTTNKSKANKPSEVQKPNFELSGKLTEDTNTFNGVVIKYSEPPEARMPKKRWRLYPFKGDQLLPPLYIHRQSAYLLGRDRKVVDMPIDHPSCSKQHAALQYRLITYERPNGSIGKQIRLYIIDLESANGTFINNKKIEPRKYVELFEKDVIKFGFSSREYVLLHEHSKDEDRTPEETQ